MLVLLAVKNGNIKHSIDKNGELLYAAILHGFWRKTVTILNFTWKASFLLLAWLYLHFPLFVCLSSNLLFNPYTHLASPPGVYQLMPFWDTVVFEFWVLLFGFNWLPLFCPLLTFKLWVCLSKYCLNLHYLHWDLSSCSQCSWFLRLTDMVIRETVETIRSKCRQTEFIPIIHSRTAP